MAKARTRKPATIVAMPVVESPVVPSSQSEGIKHSDIASRAFEIYRERGSRDGHDLDDWFQAERELRASVRVAVA